MATRRKSKTEAPPRRARRRSAKAPSPVVDSVQQIWLAGMGALARAHRDGPAAFHEAVAEGLRLLGHSRSRTQQMIHEAFEAAQDAMQTRLANVRGQAQESWDNLEALFQSRVQRALQQIGVPNAGEVRLLTRRVAELNETVKQLAARRAVTGTRRPARRARKSARGGR